MHAFSKDPLRLSAAAAPSFWPTVGDACARGLGWLAKSGPVKTARAIAAAIAAEQRARETVRELESWDDHMLRDIGLERMHVEAAVRGVHPPYRWRPDADASAADRLMHLR